VNIFGELSTSLNITGGSQQNVAPVNTGTGSGAAGQSLNLLDSTPSPSSPDILTLPPSHTPTFGDASTVSSSHTPLRQTTSTVAPRSMVETEDRLLVNIFTEAPQGAGGAGQSLNILDFTPSPSSPDLLRTLPPSHTPTFGDASTASSSHPLIRQTTSTTVAPHPSATIVQQTKDGLNPLDRRLQHPQPVPSTYDGIDSLSQRQSTSPPPQQQVSSLKLWPRPIMAPTNSHNIRQRPPTYPAPHMVYNPLPRAPESFLGPDPAHPRGPQPWTRWVQSRPFASGHRSNSWTHHSSRRRNPSHV